MPCRILALARLPRLRHLVHQPFAGGVFAVFQLQRISRGAQFRRQPERQAHRHGAAVALERDDRPAVARLQHVLLNGGFESVVVRNDNPSWIRCSFDEFRRDRIAWAPQLHGTVVDGICHAQNFRRRVSRIPVRADLLQVGLAPGLDVAKQDVRNGDVALARGAVGERLMHGAVPPALRGIAKQAGVRGDDLPPPNDLPRVGRSNTAAARHDVKFSAVCAHRLRQSGVRPVLQNVQGGLGRQGSS